ncbi:hypothetical protein [Nocardioides pelophilus]|uniref:hypothetical protein n=1 Tax=Nocardioides pelophilus TaxID=2172019 RepID=UPI0016025BB6|nr:hypothetical protein [Nocardioides pelophilus]
MRPVLAPLLLMVLVTGLVSGLVSGCSADDDPGDSGPTVTATGSDDSDESTAEPSSAEPSTGPDDGETQEPTGTADLPDAAAAVCTLYSAMVSAVQDVALSYTDPDDIAAAIAPVLKEFAAQVQALERPPGVSVEIWNGVAALAERILALPDRPTDAEVEAVERQLTPQQRDAVASAYSWLKSTCAG